MIEKLTELNYKPINNFSDEQLKKHLNFFVENRPRPASTTYYAKMLEQKIIYSTDTDATFINTISIISYFLIDTEYDLLCDNFCVISKPFDIRTEEDFETLENLFKIYRSDVEIIEQAFEGEDVIQA